MSQTLPYQQMGTAARGQAHALFAQTMAYVAGTAGMFDFQRLRTNTDSAEAPLLAASIFLDVLNVFLFFLEIFSGERRWPEITGPGPRQRRRAAGSSDLLHPTADILQTRTLLRRFPGGTCAVLTMTPEAKAEYGTENDAAKEEDHSKERPEDHCYSASHRSPSLRWPKSTPGAVPVRLTPFQSRISVVSARNAGAGCQPAPGSSETAEYCCGPKPPISVKG